MRLAGTPYELVRALGAGGAGEVYEAVHVALGVRRAVKLLRRELSGQRQVLTRFTREGRLLAQVRHPNLVEVLDLGVSSDGRPFLAMELLDGRTLRDLLRDRGALRADQAVRVAVAVLDALEVMHALGVVHRDVKPENVFVLGGRGVKLLDFGIARVASLDELTATGASIGTPRYMAPEQARGEVVDARADVWAVGALVWEMVGGAPPHAELDGVLAAAYAGRDGLPRGAFEPGALADVVFAATRPDPRDRPVSAAALRAALLAAVGAGGDDAVTVPFAVEPTALVAAAPRGAAAPLALDAPRAPDEPTPDGPRPAAPTRAPVRADPPPAARRPRPAWPAVVAAASVAVAGLAALALGARPRPHGALVPTSSGPSPPGVSASAESPASAVSAVVSDRSASVSAASARAPTVTASVSAASARAPTVIASPGAPRPPAGQPARPHRGPLPPDDLPPSGL